MDVFRAGLLDGQVAIVTGGGTGIGFAIAKLLGSLGARVAICGRQEARLLDAAEALRQAGVSTWARVCDIRDVDSVQAFVDGVGIELGDASILVNNAGGQFPTTAATVTPRGWEAVVRNNLNGTFYMTQAVALAHMIPKKRGRIVNVTANVRRGFPGMVHTGAARAGVENMTKTLAIEWAEHKIQVNAVAPGLIDTDASRNYPPELFTACVRRTPLKRTGSAEEIANLVAYLASPAASFVTGQTWYIDGGASLWGETWPIPDPERA